MEDPAIPAAAFVVSGLALFSGFGLGTALMPTFALVVPVAMAVAATALVHLANNPFKLVLAGREAEWTLVRRCGAPVAVAALAGAGLLSFVAGLPGRGTRQLGGREFQVTAVKA